MIQGSFLGQVLGRRPTRGKGWANRGARAGTFPTKLQPPCPRGQAPGWAPVQEKPGWSDFTPVRELVPGILVSSQLGALAVVLSPCPQFSHTHAYTP